MSKQDIPFPNSEKALFRGECKLSVFVTLLRLPQPSLWHTIVCGPLHCSISQLAIVTTLQFLPKAPTSLKPTAPHFISSLKLVGEFHKHNLVHLLKKLRTLQYFSLFLILFPKIYSPLSSLHFWLPLESPEGLHLVHTRNMLPIRKEAQRQNGDSRK